LVADADVFVQSYRPESLAGKGFSPADLAARRPGIVVVSLAAYGHTGPWRARRGFDSLVQMSSGIAAHAGLDRPRALPAQALDHGTGWLAAYGVMTALHRRATEGGSWHVKLSLARTAEWLHDLGRQDEPVSEVDPKPWLTETDSDFGRLTHIRVPCASVEPAGPRKPGRDPAVWW
jgi:crotonobetainyl-CoA:carnitine CoA-transferase CaiB-like acyl-CoA transferase